jgi:hypothetical protein
VVTAAAGHAGQGACRQAHVKTPPDTSSRGTATRSTRAASRGPPHTTRVASSPSATAQSRGSPTPTYAAVIEAAIALLRAIQAKFVTKRSSASAWAPE